MRIALLASGSEEWANWDLPSMLELQCQRYWQNSELWSCVSLLFPLLLCVSHDIKRGVSLAVGHSPMQDAAFYELSSMVEVCLQLFSSLQRETLPCSSSIYRQLSLVGFCKSPPSELATCSAESARAELVLFEISLLYMCSRLSAILVRFVYLKRTTVGLKCWSCDFQPIRSLHLVTCTPF